MFFVWFYAALSVARSSGQGFNARSFADKHCVTLSHYGMRAVAVGLLPLRHVHLVHQVHRAGCFVTKIAPQFCFRRQTAAVRKIEICLKPSKNQKIFNSRYVQRD